MVRRDKRLLKGIISIEKQIKIHKEKLLRAKEIRNEYLEGYYEKEIESLEKTKDIKKSKLEK
jgi:hypothetical protein